ncbi:MAG TPA: helix-turn-helix transcriptional regulator [Acidothermaceae bacterium]
MARKAHAYSAQTLDTVRVLGLEIARARRARRWPAQELATRAGISRATLSAVESGVPTVAIGVVFEVAVLVGIDLLGASAQQLPGLIEASRNRLELLPASVRARASDTEGDDNF